MTASAPFQWLYEHRTLAEVDADLALAKDTLSRNADDLPRTGLSARVVAIHRSYPDWGATRIAQAIGRNDAYVRVVAKRHGLDLPRSAQGAFPSRWPALYARKAVSKLASASCVAPDARTKTLCDRSPALRRDPERLDLRIRSTTKENRPSIHYPAATLKRRPASISALSCIAHGVSQTLLDQLAGKTSRIARPISKG